LSISAPIRKADERTQLIDLDDDLISHAATDGLWLLLMLAGATEVVPMEVAFPGYEAPTYYSMIVATYGPAG